MSGVTVVTDWADINEGDRIVVTYENGDRLSGIASGKPFYPSMRLRSGATGDAWISLTGARAVIVEQPDMIIDPDTLPARPGFVIEVTSVNEETSGKWFIFGPNGSWYDDREGVGMSAKVFVTRKGITGFKIVGKPVAS